jgi:hypothetical protein
MPLLQDKVPLLELYDTANMHIMRGVTYKVKSMHLNSPCTSSVSFMYVR